MLLSDRRCGLGVCRVATRKPVKKFFSSAVATVGRDQPPRKTSVLHRPERLSNRCAPLLFGLQSIGCDNIVRCVMGPRMKPVLFVACVFLLGCGGDSSSSSGTCKPSCSISFNGAASGEFACTSSISYISDDKSTNVGLSVGTSSSTPSVDLIAGFGAWRSPKSERADHQNRSGRSLGRSHRRP